MVVLTLNFLLCRKHGYGTWFKKELGIKVAGNLNCRYLWTDKLMIYVVHPL